MGFRELDYYEIEDFICPLKTTIDLTYGEYANLFEFKWHNGAYGELNRIIFGKYSPILKDLNLKPTNLYSISFTPHKDGKWDFRLSPITFLNNIFKELGLPNEIPFIDLDDRYGLACFDDFVYKNVNQVLANTDDINTICVMEKIILSIPQINRLYDTDINSLIENKSLPKDVLFTLAYKSLDNYIETQEEIYKILPYYYYHRIASKNVISYPHAIKPESIWIDQYCNMYKHYITEEYIPNINPYKLESKNIVIGIDILKPGSIDKELTDIVHKVRAQSNVDYDKYRELFEKKVNFYRNSPYVNTVLGRYGLSGYIGFTYSNEYLVFDKFYNSDTIDPSDRTILTHGEAIYALPSDRFSLIATDKQVIKEERKIDDRIHKFNHNETFIERIEPIITGPNLSTSTFDVEYEKFNQKILTKKI